MMIFSTAKQKTHSNSNKFENHSQLRLFPNNTSPQNLQPKETRPTNPPRSKPRPKPKPELAIEPVRSEFEGDRYCLCYGTFTLRLELPKDQAYELFDWTVRLDWSLDDRGVPTDIARIWAAAESALGGGLD
ncbi:MAG: hypothetical protein J0L70_23220 [Leptolyngbya sp. UWPOB_LEPTO1]|uniref:hypothetical protein n=1 Tax=Leptolyngbya sp. UWPOB_LEPTO1 TaxID=2815653 RepID=UPI001ACE644E|nr:hypothetical protein [Leptolyngbya sp. UWPOB_LEPTO1]MBN8563452.1 hypothetical protein [Leptolyngbya sp. UWPOB_LEPTO1]